jgi:mycoredoxin
METIELYTRPGCPFCFMLRRRLRKRGIAFHEINIWQDSAARALVRAAGDGNEIGNEIVPTVRVGARWLVNPSVDDVAAQIGRVEMDDRAMVPAPFVAQDNDQVRACDPSIRPTS